MLCHNPVPTNPPDKLRAVAVIVLYEKSPEESPAFRSLLAARERAPAGLVAVSIVLWDNSPTRHDVSLLPYGVIYRHDPNNPGLALAYNRAVEVAIQQQSDWLITLDQDSELPHDYLICMVSVARSYGARPDVAAIVPQIAIGSKRLSPYFFQLGAIPRWYRPGFRGIPSEPVFAFNSGAMLRVDAVRQVGAYDLRFPLEYSDTAMFHKLRHYGKRVHIEGSVQIGHEFSLVEMNRLLSKERYRRTLVAETALWDLHMNRLAGCERTARLALRMVRHWLRRDRRELRRITCEFLLYRLFYSRKTRLRRWRESLGQMRPSCSTLAQPNRLRPKVSVCMAAFNGAKFIRAQLESILSQLKSGDEVVIIDDASHDDTVARILEIDDARIRLFAHDRNQGVVATFEDALRSATGDILFLADDDDLWVSSKVEKVLWAFEQNPQANIVTSRVALMDEQGAPLPDACVNRYGRFLPGFWRNIFKNHYQGSAMTIRASFLGKILPFPRASQFLHDAWIGTRNDALGGETVFIDEPLVYYRRHAQNASQTHSFFARIRVRVDLLLAHLAHSLGVARSRSLQAD